MTQPALAFEATNDAVRLLEARFRDHEITAEDEDGSAKLPDSIWEQVLLGPLAEFLSRPGKQFRSRLVRLAWELSGRRTAPPPELPLIVEALHAGSLIVDDIEDGSTYRRGALSLHHLHGVPLALNAGNWLYFWPARLLSRLELPPVTELSLHRVIGQTLLACHEGQALDLGTRVIDLEQSRVATVVLTTTRLKTGKLFELAATLGAVAAGAPSPTVRALSKFASSLGVGLQMLDDLGGLTSEARCHKGHEDLIGARPSWPWAWTAESVDRLHFARLRELGREVVHHRLHPEHLAKALREALGEQPAARVRNHLGTAFEDLKRALGPSRALEDISIEIQELERSYG